VRLANISDSLIFFDQGGLYPPGWKGWHLSSLTSDSVHPFSMPYFIMARRA